MSKKLKGWDWPVWCWTLWWTHFCHTQKYKATERVKVAHKICRKFVFVEPGAKASGAYICFLLSKWFPMDILHSSKPFSAYHVPKTTADFILAQSWPHSSPDPWIRGRLPCTCVAYWSSGCIGHAFLTSNTSGSKHVWLKSGKSFTGIPLTL